MSYLPPPILFRQHDRAGLSPHQALILADAAVKDGRYHDAERLIEIVFNRIEAQISPGATHH